MLRTLIVSISLALATPVVAAPNKQLVASVQHRLNVLGFSKVDAGTLSTAQIGALHLRLQGSFAFGYNRIRKQQEVKVILQWKN